MTLLVPLKHFILLRTTNKSLIYPGKIPFTALKINMAMSCGRRLDKVKVVRNSFHFPETSSQILSKLCLVHRITMKFGTEIKETS